MDNSNGTLVIFALVITVGPGFAVMQRERAISRVYCSRSEAQTMINEHDRQVRMIDSSVRYRYEWQAQPEQMEVRLEAVSRAK